MKFYTKHKKILNLSAVLILLGIIFLLLRQSSLTLLPAQEAERMQALAAHKEQASLGEFVTDGCSGNVSAGWSTTVATMSEFSQTFAATYSDTIDVPFESACVEHDRLYHAGEGGYIGRLEADRKLRADIIDYAIQNAPEIRERLRLTYDEEAIHLYELLAETIYRGVRLGGGPCTAKPYAWGYGYGACVE